MRLRIVTFASLLGLAAFLVYRYTAAPDLLAGDAAEFQFTVPLAGVAHPTGYPLYHLLGWLWSQLYVANPAQGVNHFSALWGGIAVATFYLLSYEVLGQLLARLQWRRGAAFLAGVTTLVFAGNPTFWAEATQAEVYTLHAALVAALLGVTLKSGASTGRQDRRSSSPGRLWLVFLLLGLGLAHHLTTLLFIPALFLYLLLVQPAALAPGRLLRLLPWLLAPLLLYLYIPLRAPSSPWLQPALAAGQPLMLFDDSLLGVMRFVLGARFASALHALAEALNQMPFAAQMFLLHFRWPGLALILLGLLSLVFEGKLRTLVFMLFSFVGLVIFNLFYGIEDIAPLYIAPMLIATLWLGLGLAYTVELVTRISSPGLRPYLLALTLAILALPYLHFQAHGAEVVRRGDYANRLRWLAILEQPLASDAILVSNDRDEMAPFIYLQQIEGRGRGMTALFPLIAPGPAWSDLNGTLATALTADRPVYTIKDMPGLEVLYQLQPLDRGVHLVEGRHAAPEPSFELPYTDTLRWLNIEWSGDTNPGGELLVHLTWRVTQPPPAPWHSFLQLYNEAGEKVKQADDHRPGGDFAPASLWRAGDVIVDTFRLPLPDDLPPGGYTLVAGFYDPDSEQRIADPLPVALVMSP